MPSRQIGKGHPAGRNRSRTNSPAHPESWGRGPFAISADSGCRRASFWTGVSCACQDFGACGMARRGSSQLYCWGLHRLPVPCRSIGARPRLGGGRGDRGRPRHHGVVSRAKTGNRCRFWRLVGTELRHRIPRCCWMRSRPDSPVVQTSRHRLALGVFRLAGLGGSTVGNSLGTSTAPGRTTATRRHVPCATPLPQARAATPLARSAAPAPLAPSAHPRSAWRAQVSAYETACPVSRPSSCRCQPAGPTRACCELGIMGRPRICPRAVKIRSYS